jgi:hypothetical protein
MPINRYLRYEWDKSIINKCVEIAQRGEAELCNRTSLLMMRYHTCVVQYFIYDRPEFKKKLFFFLPK